MLSYNWILAWVRSRAQGKYKVRYDLTFKRELAWYQCSHVNVGMQNFEDIFHFNY